ncbi:Na+/H+ antiporter subunit G [Fuscibacter oryzae]|uniref:Na+/H+ antiporter subunit G n=1 Tax=Fuscibacter oryzae TaxID=2803939 RepID=A0A8J7SSJ0_9RHOB|nr:Na+/H+ antiporter subunit G [Fuscibacter oryzae]MBL4926777.1 Na+/H+ antiporter subunit G [Fuscibacter oryzae]
MILDLLITAALIIGGAFALIGSYGLLRLKDPFQRLHAPTKGSTLGVGAVLVASALAHFARGQGASWHEVLVTGFIFLTAPLTALYLARVHLHRAEPKPPLPSPATGSGWASRDLGLENIQPEREKE